MIVPDVNLLIFAYHEQSPYHEAASHWWEGLINGDETVGIPWAVSMGFVRQMANPSILETPMRPSESLGRVKSWFQYAHIRSLDPGAEPSYPLAEHSRCCRRRREAGYGCTYCCACNRTSGGGAFPRFGFWTVPRTPVVQSYLSSSQTPVIEIIGGFRTAFRIHANAFPVVLG